MARKLLLPLVLAVSVATTAPALTFQVGAIGSEGLAFSYGSYFTDKAAALAEISASSLSKEGSSTDELFPEWSGGVFAEMDFLNDMLGVRLEPRYAFLGALRLAQTASGKTFDQYGLYYSSILIPVMARGMLPVGPGSITASVGPFLGIVVGDVVVVDRYKTTETTASLAADGWDPLFVGLTGGLGYQMPLGPGIASLELRADWAFTAIAETRLGDEMEAIGATLMAGYSIPLGGN